MNRGLLTTGMLLAVLTGALGGWYAARHMPHEHRLVQVSDAQGTYWTCPMHPQVRQAGPGICPICGMPLVDRAASSATPVGASSARTVLYWYDPMKPDQHFDKPGKSPYMDMELVPKYAEDGAAESAGSVVTIDPRMAQNLGMRTAEVRSGELQARTEVTGTVLIDETHQYVVEARAAGWVERLDVRAVGETVRAGQTVARIFSPEIRAAQEELGVATRLQDQTLIDAARSRLRLLGVGTDARGAPQVPVVAAHGGIVTEVGVRQGAQVTPGMPLLKLADLSRVWVIVEIPEGQSGDLSTGMKVEARLTGLPGKSFAGTVDFVYPVVDDATRTVRARLSFPNPHGELKPGMYAAVTLQGPVRQSVTLIPSEALIVTGTRSTVLVAEAEGRYRPVHVRVGAEQGEQTVILSGLQAGQKIVVSGQFLIDSEANLLGAYERLGGTPDDAQSPAAMTRNMGGSPAPGAYEVQAEHGDHP